MDRTDPNMRFTLPSDRPLPNKWSRKAAASDDEYNVMGLLPNASATYLPLRLAARMKVGVCLSAFSLRLGIDSLHHGRAVIWHVSFVMYDRMQSWHIHLLQSQPMPVVIEPLANRHS